MSMRTIAAISLALILAQTDLVSAQDQTLLPGARIRLQVGTHTFDGLFRGITSDSVLMTQVVHGAAPVDLAFHRDAVARLQTRRRMNPAVPLLALVGGAVYGLTGHPGLPHFAGDGDISGLIEVTVLAVAGGVVGLMVAAEQRWVTVRLRAP